MNKVGAFLAFAVSMLPSLAAAAGPAAVPITMVGVQVVGPERIGSLPPVVEPADNPQTSAKILLGKQLYFDPRLSKDGTTSCATCHDPARGWSDAGPTSVGVGGQRGGRRSPPVANAAHSPLQFWDGRAPNLEEQAKGPIENPIEMGNTHALMVGTLVDIPGYVQQFAAVFGTGPITVDQVAQAIAAYERTIVTSDSPFDRFVRGDQRALTPLERRGLEIFNGKGHCSACHWGGNLSDGRFHNLGVQPASGAKPDDGRFEVTKDRRDKGAFKTPTIRDAAARAPYMHNGSEKSLETVVDLYNRGGGGDGSNLDALMVPLGLSGREVQALVAFMQRAMTSPNPSVADEEPIPASELPR